jgi:hypothetical protein
VFAGLSACAGLSAGADFLNGGRTQTLSGLSADADFLNGGRTQTLSQLLRSCLGFLLFASFQEQALALLTIKNPVTFVTGFVPRTGIEPALPCDNQILSLARLPVPPSGHFAPRCSAGCNITLSAEFCQNTIEVFFLIIILFYLQHCFLGNRIDLIHFQIAFNRFQDFILYGFNLT